MNIFVLDSCPIKAAQCQIDKHIVKMPLETAQLLCSVFDEGKAPYKRTHYNHPCAIWVRESLGNFQWLVKHGYALCDEYEARYSKVHKCKEVISWCETNIKPEMFTKTEQTSHPKCIPDDCKVEDVVQSYQNYYIAHKKDIAKWKRNQPSWWPKA